MLFRKISFLLLALQVLQAQDKIQIFLGMTKCCTLGHWKCLQLQRSQYFSISGMSQQLSCLPFRAMRVHTSLLSLFSCCICKIYLGCQTNTPVVPFLGLLLIIFLLKVNLIVVHLYFPRHMRKELLLFYAKPR